MENFDFPSMDKDFNIAGADTRYDELNHITGGLEKDKGVSLMKDHFSLSKAFSKSIFRIMQAFFPFIFSK